MKASIKPGTNNNIRLFLKPPFPEKLLDEVRSIPGRKWHVKEKVWYLPDSNQTYRLLEIIFKDKPVDIDPSLKELLLRISKRQFLIHEALEKVKEELILRRHSRNTIKNYLYHLKTFFLSIDKPINPINELSCLDARSYLLHIVQVKKVSRSFHDQAISAIKFYFEKVLDQQIDTKQVPRPKKEKRLPVVMSRLSINQLLQQVRNLKHRAILLLIYSAGLRVSEAAGLRIDDMDCSRMMLRIYQGKGRKDRYTLLSKKALEEVKKYMAIYKPKKWLFPGMREGRHISTRTIEKVFCVAREKAELSMTNKVHSMRHSFATHLHEDGTDIRHIQELLGHASVKTTEIYTHVSKAKIARIESPLDRMQIDDLESD